MTFQPLCKRQISKVSLQHIRAMKTLTHPVYVPKSSRCICLYTARSFRQIIMLSHHAQLTVTDVINNNCSETMFLIQSLYCYLVLSLLYCRTTVWCIYCSNFMVCSNNKTVIGTLKYDNQTS